VKSLIDTARTHVDEVDFANNNISWTRTLFVLELYNTWLNHIFGTLTRRHPSKSDEDESKAWQARVHNNIVGLPSKLRVGNEWKKRGAVEDNQC